MLAIAEGRCSDSAWAVPYLAKLAAAVPDRIELRVVTPAEGGARLQAANLTPDGRKATPTIVVLDEQDRILGTWVERPVELQKWYVEHKATVAQAERYSHLDKWYTDDAGRTTIAEVLATIATRQGGYAIMVDPDRIDLRRFDPRRLAGMGRTRPQRRAGPAPQSAARSAPGSDADNAF